MENQLVMEKENSVWTKTQLLVFYVIILLAIDEYVFRARCCCAGNQSPMTALRDQHMNLLYHIPTRSHSTKC
jgi:hypothetical protein